jgi:hypothetical protein
MPVPAMETDDNVHTYSLAGWHLPRRAAAQGSMGDSLAAGPRDAWVHSDGQRRPTTASDSE